LEKNAKELEVLPSYDPDFYVTLDSSDYPEEDRETEAVYWYPPLDTSWWMTTGGAPAWYPKPRFVKAEDVIPDETIALEEGAKVVSKDGERLGNVEEVIVESAEDVATHFVISKGLFLKERKLIPTVWIAEVEEDRVALSVTSDFVDRLPEHDSVK
jgi:sporulation protein YlmC with PRC-barrel domain